MRQLSPKQKEFWNAPLHRWNIKYGATRTGKTYLDYFMIPRRIRERAGQEGLVVLMGNTKPNTDSGGASGGSHVHGMLHDHSVFVETNIPALNVPLSSHSHDVNFPDHTHQDNPGIYRGTTASSVTIEVDGNTVPASAITNKEFDAVPYLSKDSAGRIRRGTWHTIRITPNVLTRIVADVYVKTFIRSISGGNY